jgi:hypothetical protein
MSLHRCNKKTDKLYLELSDCEILYAIQVYATYYKNMPSRLSYTIKNLFWVCLSTFKDDRFFHTRYIKRLL